MTAWVNVVVLGGEVKVGDYLGSDQMEVKGLTTPEVQGLNQCQNPPMLTPAGKCGCHSPAARLTQLPRSVARGPQGERVVLIHHLPYKITTLR